MKFLLLVILITSISLQAKAGESKKIAINLLMEKSGIDRQINQIPQQILQSVKQQASRSLSSTGPSLVFESLVEAVNYAYKVDLIKQKVSDNLYENLTDDDVLSILKWFASDIGREITETEVSVSESLATQNGIADMNSFVSRLKMLPANENRMQMIKRLDNAVLATDFTVDTALNTGISFMKAMQKTIPNSKQSDSAGMDKQIEEQLEIQREALKPILREVVEKTLLYTYKNTADEHLSAYVNFCDSIAGRKFYKVTFSALGKTLSGVNTEMADYFASKIQLKTPPPTSPYAVPQNMLPQLPKMNY